MNPIQSDELLAISSIYPNCLTTQQFEDHIEVLIKIEIDWEEEREVLVLDTILPSPFKQELISSGGRIDDIDSIGETKNQSRHQTSSKSKSKSKQQYSKINNNNKLNNNNKNYQDRPIPRSSVVITLSPTGSTPLDSFPPPPPPPPIQTTVLSPTSATFNPFTTAPSNSPASATEGRSILTSKEMDEEKKISNLISTRKPVPLEIRYLPPLELKVILTTGYPSTEAPRFSLKTWKNNSALVKRGGEEKIDAEEDEGWLGMEGRKVLEGRLNELWQAEEECLWFAVDLLRGESIIGILDLKFPLLLEQSKVSPSFPLPLPFSLSAHTTILSVVSTSNLSPQTPLLSDQIKLHDRLSKSQVFKSENYECGICLEAKKGSRCIRLKSCGDVFCHPCLLSYFTLLITEGLVRSVHCPSITCVKSRVLYERSHPPSIYSGTTSTAMTSNDDEKPGEVEKEELEEIVGGELTSRWEELGEKMRVDSDLSFSRCPREACQAAVPSGGDESKLRICGACGYSYCVFCRRGWHGTINQCSIPQSSLIVTAFLSGSPLEQQALEQKYGTANMRRLVAVFEEDRLNREWIEKNSTSCPGCLIRVEKVAGCAHMQCNRCGIHFCYLCGSKVSALDPYLHYSTPGVGCFNKLFEGVPNPNYY